MLDIARKPARSLGAFAGLGCGGVGSSAVGDSKAKTREAAKQETREALIRAGMSLFSEEGVDLPSLDAICAHAGFTRGAFYVHFKDREEFLVAVVDRAIGDFLDSVVAMGAGDDDLSVTVDRFLLAAEAGSVPFMGDRKLTNFLISSGKNRSPEIRARFLALLEGAMQRIAAGVESGRRAGKVGTQVEGDLVALWLVSAALGLSTLLDVGTQVDFARVRESARRLLQIDGE